MLYVPIQYPSVLYDPATGTAITVRSATEAAAVPVYQAVPVREVAKPADPAPRARVEPRRGGHE